MRTGARRKTQSSELPPSPPPPPPPPHSLQNDITDEGKDQVDYDKGKRQQVQEQPQPQPTNDGGNEYDEEEGGDYEEDDQSGDEDEDEDRPKLAEGFYEIEAVRRRRIRKGEKQYLIKWRGWPESANTWEPVENLMSISEYIDAFDQRYGKHRSNRKRKHKHSVASTSNSRKKQQQQQHSPAATDEITDDIPAVKITVIEEPLSVHNSNFANGTANQSNDLLIGERRERNEVDIQLPELKAASSSNQENVSEFSIDIQEDRAVGVSPIEARPMDGSPKVTRVSPCVGARRRKSGAVRRFRKESNSGDAPGDTSDGGGVGEEMKNPVVVENELDCNNIVDVPVTKIIKPVNYSRSEHNGTEDICVSFLVRRSNGEESVVDNKYLKENNPVMLINFYEQHLRYNNPPE